MTKHLWVVALPLFGVLLWRADLTWAAAACGALWFMNIGISLARWNDRRQEAEKKAIYAEFSRALSHCRQCGEFRGHGHECTPRGEKER